MANFQTGNMWDVFEQAELFLITTNSTVTKDGRLVMGAGIAKQAKLKYRGLDKKMGTAVLKACGNLGEYNLLFGQGKLAGFQVKYYWGDNADLDLIQRSTNKLLELPEMIIHLNFPGIGNGKLDRTKVYDIIKVLPDNITIWEEK